MIKAAMQFSGGKDSLALLFHLKELLPLIDVVVVDTGHMTTDAYANFKIAKEMVPAHQFHVLTPRRERNQDSWVTCCADNIWIPMNDFVTARRYRQVFRGSKRCDPHFHGVYPGDIVNNVLYTMPLWDWTDEEVKQYLGTRLPQPYEHASGMPDCADCIHPEACGGHRRHVWSKK